VALMAVALMAVAPLTALWRTRWRAGAPVGAAGCEGFLCIRAI
jgi:hypothetical protein